VVRLDCHNAFPKRHLRAKLQDGGEGSLLLDHLNT